MLLAVQWKEQFLHPKWHMWQKNFMIWVALKFPLAIQLELVHQVMRSTAFCFLSTKICLNLIRTATNMKLFLEFSSTDKASVLAFMYRPPYYISLMNGSQIICFLSNFVSLFCLRYRCSHA